MTGTTELRSIYSGPIRRALEGLERKVSTIEEAGGVPGPTGPTGPAGPAGPTGATGPAGPPGADAPSPGTWTTITLGLGWVAEPASHVPAYRIIGDLVYIRGVASLTGTFAAGTLATLPVGARPPAALRYQLGARKVGATGQWFIGVSISSAGLLALSAYNNSDQVNPLLYLDMIPPYSLTA